MENANAADTGFAKRFKLEIPIRKIIALRPRILNVLKIANALHRRNTDFWPFELQKKYYDKMELVRLDECIHNFDNEIKRIDRSSHYNAIGFTTYIPYPSVFSSSGLYPIVLSTGGLIYINEKIDKEQGELGFCAKLVNEYGNTFRNFEEEFFKYTGVTDPSRIV